MCSPVGLKEAALDSPTFRSSYTHFTEQVDLIEKWLETWLKSVSKITNEVAPLEGIINGFLSQAAPPTNVSEAVLDHDYTLLALKRYGDAAREIWTSTILSMKRMEANMVEPIRSLLQNDLRNFKVRHVLLPGFNCCLAEAISRRAAVFSNRLKRFTTVFSIDTPRKLKRKNPRH